MDRKALCQRAKHPANTEYVRDNNGYQDENVRFLCNNYGITSYDIPEGLCSETNVLAF